MNEPGVEAFVPDDAARVLLALARRSIELALDDGPVPRPDAADPAMDARCGAFVTIRIGRRLRGCIGRVESDWPLWETVARMARASAFEDPRFPPLRADELERATLEISVMSPPRVVADPAEVVPGVHGVMLERGVCRGLFLPQVAREQGWTRERLLDELSLKAGLPPGAWREPGALLSVFTAQVIEEEG